MFAANAQLIVDRFGSEFADQLEGIPGTEEVRVRILKQTADYYSQLIEYSKQDSALAANAAHAEHRLAIISQRLGKLDEAGQAFQNALRKWQRALLADPYNLAKMVSFASCHRDLALLQSRLGDIEAAQASFGDAMRLIDTDLLRKCNDTKLLCEVGRTRSEFGLFLAKTDRRQQAIELFQLSANDIEEALKRQSSKGEALLQYQLAFVLNNHATIVMESQPNEARRLLRQAEESLRDSPLRDGYELSHPMLAAVLQSNLGVAEGRLDHSQAATDCFQLAIAKLSAILQHYPDYVKAHVEQAACLNNWAQLHLDQREFDKAQKRFEEAESLLIAAQTKFPRQPEIPLFLHRVQRNLGVLMESRKRLQNTSEEHQDNVRVKEENLSANILFLDLEDRNELPEPLALYGPSEL
jgi:tetratricopeptide (TPR) repeat protein